MANPRKFSEKIALHNQKQAEETAAFEAILKEVNCATKPTPNIYPKQHLPIAQNLGAYRGGSLPNVNQIGSNQGIDLQTALQHLEDMKTGRPNLTDRFHRDRQRQTPCHRRGINIMDKRAESSPYGSTYLSPPPDTSWRRNYPYLNGATLSRTNSDSALHTSAMVYPNQEFGQTTPPTHRRTEMVENSMPDMQRGYWDPKKLAQSRPKSCEVPNINIYPSQDQDSGIHIPISNNTGSLPDLTVLHFPSPMVTPLDVDEQQQQQQQHYGNQGNSPTSLSPTSPQYNNMSGQMTHTTQQSPGPRRRPAQGVPSPLVLNNGNHMSMPLSPPAGSVDPSKLTPEARMRQQYMNMYRHRTPGSQTTHPRHHTPTRILHNHHRSQHPHKTTTQPTTPPNVPRVQITSCDQQDQSQPSMTQYRNSVDGGCQSPTSPLSQPSYSPAQSPGLPPVSTANNSPFAEAYYIQQQQQTNALQHQFEHFNMVRIDSHDIPNSTMVSSPTSSLANNSMAINTSLAYTQACSQALIGSSSDFHQRYFQQLESSMCPSTFLTTSSHSPHSQSLSSISQHLSQSNQIPDIVLTGADDILGRPNHDFAKDLGNAIIGMTDGFDTDFFSTDEAFKAGLDPLDLDGLQMLTDPSMVTDPATEDTFKLDRL
ncbi:CREB-regulated transcription coactivator 1 isoform X2 [Patella vulgata]|uniref:CREB-regulated transcription coactivator 1 isoform X2 n=1 Tax=Patella vulgata TaxID=6465 RepID=UPI0024A8BDD8|nr:CREB-regulated transcription coactivator 1 isoform X2 [Patella vulgata]